MKIQLSRRAPLWLRLDDGRVLMLSLNSRQTVDVEIHFSPSVTLLQAPPTDERKLNRLAFKVPAHDAFAIFDGVPAATSPGGLLAVVREFAASPEGFRVVVLAPPSVVIRRNSARRQGGPAAHA